MSNFTKLKLCHTLGISQHTHVWVKGALTALLLVLCGNVAKAQSDLTFKEGIRYSKWVIDSRMNEFYANTTKCGFAVYDQSGKQTADRVDGKKELDYVVGLVAKSIIEASQYYSQFTWAQSFAKPWFLSIQNYGDNFYSKFSTSGGSLDDLNAVKLFIPLRALTATNGTYPNTTTHGYTKTALDNAITGLIAHNSSYSIKSGTLAETAGKTVLGGWWHKKAYENQMWLDGAYMGPALFAELVNYSGTTKNIDSSNDWDLIVKQFTILHEMCWNSTDKLPYHAFAADGGTNSTSHSDTWAGLSSSNPYCFHSASYWGRAVGWYFLALVDILEQMEKANIASTDSKFTTLKGYLTEIADGLVARQDQATGGWYQILDENSTYSASSYNGKSYTQTYNYIESSATALFTAAYLKAIRKGYLAENDYKTVAVNGYKCLINQFFSVDDNGNVNIFGSCRSAGLGGSGDNYKAGKERFRDGSKPYYLLGYDVARVDKSEKITEGKVLGAFILAATEYERQYQHSMLLSKDLNKTYTLSSNESLTVEVLGDGTAEYQWYDATGSTPSAIKGATCASYTPTQSGKYYCVITVTPPTTAAKTRAASTTEPYTITTSTAEVTVESTGTETGGTETSNDIFSLTVTYNQQYELASGADLNLTSDYATVTGGSALVHNGKSSAVNIIYLKNNKGNIALNGSNSTYVKLTLNTPLQEGDVITFTSDESSIGSFYLTTTSTKNDNCSVSDGTYTVTSSDGLANSTELYVWSNSSGKFKSITITRSGSSTETPTGYTITYNLNGHGDAIADVTNATALPEELPTPTATGYTFGDWYTDADCTTAATPGTTISANTTLYAKWTIKKYNVTATAEYGSIAIVDGDGNPVQSNTEVPYGTSLTFTATPNEGYEFSSWTVTGTNGTESSNVYTIESLNAETTVTANFTKTSSGGGETGGSVTSEVIYFTSGTTSSNENVLKVNSGNNKSDLSVNYGGQTYTNGVKMESSTDITLKLTAESKVTFVFDTASKKFKIGETSYTTNESGTYTTTLAAGTYTIKKDDASVNLVAVDIQPTGPSMSISTQPASAEYVTGATATALSVGVTFNNATESDYTVTYQWYENTTNSNTGGTKISEATAASYIPTLSSTGTTYYYCVVTAEKEGSENLTATSDVAVITVSDPYIKFTTQPTGAQYSKNDAATALSVEATTNFNGTVSYQWYENTTNSRDGATAINDETNATYTPSTSTVGTKYYFCKASATVNGETYEDISNIVSIEVVTAIYKYKVAKGDASPGVNGVKYIKDNADNIKVKMTFGGWKWGTNSEKNDHTYTMPNKTNTLTDSWSAAKTEGVAKLDGYDYWFVGGQDAVDESKASNGIIYGTERYGWFKTKTTDAAGKVTTYPFSLPVRGAYMTFEPTQNGWLTIYILQNGAWNSDTNNNIDIKPGEFRMHSFFITNQRGLTVQDFAPNMYSYEVNQKVETGYSCSVYEDKDKPADNDMDENKKDISYWPEFWTLDDKEREAVYTHWANGDNGSETVIELSNGSFLLIQKAVIKYRFHVTGNETYYFFSNFSKMGFSGATFQPDDAQPTDELTLSDTEKYTAPTAGTDGKVYNVTIPQYKSITFTRTFKPNQWTTLTLPFNLTQDEVQRIFGAGTQIIMLDKATLSSEGGARLHFIYHEIQNVLPGYPYLIKPTLTDITNDANVEVIKDNNNNTITSFTVYGKCINPHISQFEVNTTPYTFMGTPGYCTPDATDKKGYSVNYKENDIFVSETNGNLYVSGGSSYGKGYRAWLQKKKDGTTAVKSISVVMSSFSDDDDTTTSIDVAEMAPDLIEALGIQTGVYNLSGQRVANDTHNLKAGIYIVNGKKTVVR